MGNLFVINHEDLFDLDRFLEIEDPDQIDNEIEGIARNLWDGVGQYEELLKPFFTGSLLCHLLRPLYFSYFSLNKIQHNYSKVVINASHLMMDIAARFLDIELSPTRTLHDREFYLIRLFQFSALHRNFSFKEEILRKVAWIYFKVIGKTKGYEILYADAGKLEADFREIKHKLIAYRIPIRTSRRLKYDHDAICGQVKKNISKRKLSIPVFCVQQLIEHRVLAYLPELFDRIGSIADVIEDFRIKLVISSSYTHEDHLCLMAAAKIANTKSLAITHGITFAGNPFLDHYMTHQATINEIEPRYNGSIPIKMRYKWFERKI